MQPGAILYPVTSGKKILAITPSKALVSSIKSRSRLKWASRGADTSRFLSLLKACIHMALK